MGETQTPGSWGDELAAISAAWLGPEPSDERRDRYVDTVSLVLMRMMPTLDAASLSDEERELFQRAMGRTGVNELVRSVEDFERVLEEFALAHPPDEELLAQLEATLARHAPADDS